MGHNPYFYTTIYRLRDSASYLVKLRALQTALKIKLVYKYNILLFTSYPDLTEVPNIIITNAGFPCSLSPLFLRNEMGTGMKDFFQSYL